MKESHSITNNLLSEVDVLTNRLRNIKQTFKTTYNIRLKERLLTENNYIVSTAENANQAKEKLQYLQANGSISIFLSAVLDVSFWRDCLRTLHRDI